MRRAPARLAAIVLLVVTAASFDARAFRAGVTRVTGGDPAAETAFAFDPDFRAFLLDVRARTRPEETIRVEAPKTELHILQAAYRLTPRRVLAAGVPGDADWVAVYRPSAPDASARPISGGLLRRER